MTKYDISDEGTLDKAPEGHGIFRREKTCKTIYEVLDDEYFKQ